MKACPTDALRQLMAAFLSGAVCLSTVVSADTAPGTISEVPLVTQGGAKPNLMIMLDSSGSMGNNVPGTTDKRIDVVKLAAKNLIDSLNDGSMRVGLARFNGGRGARVLENLTLLDASEKNTIKTKIDDIGTGGVTPLAEASSDIARYFTYGYPKESDLILNPGGSYGRVASQKSVESIFINDPDYAFGVSAPSETVQYYCQKNFFMLLTDGLPNDDFNVSDDLKDYDSDCSVVDDDGTDVAVGVGSGEDDGQCRINGSGSDYLDDVTTAMYDMDLRPDFVGPDSSNPVKNNISSYMVGFAAGELEDSALLGSAASQAGGQYIYASNSDQLNSAFQSILSDIFSKVGASSAASFNSTSMSSDTAVYLASYNSENWSGSLVAQEFDANGELIATPKWDAGAKLDARSLTTNPRFILTYESDVGKVFDGGLIALDPDLTTPHQEDLGIDAATGLDDGKASSRLAYISGDNSDEGLNSASFRRRSSDLGDIVNSTPVFVGAPSFNYPDTDPFGASFTRYSDFVEAQENRSAIVYVGANDGMLHGFDAETGEERIAYVPGLLLSSESSEGLHYLASQNYQHKFYVNLTPTVADAYFGNGWHTVLAGGLGAGGKGYFFLDITDPTQFSAENAGDIVLGEVGLGDADMGLSFSQPKIALLNNNRWAAIFGNGYNSDSGKAVLYIYYFDDKTVKKIDTGWTDASGNGDKNGLSTPSLADVNGDGIVDRVYAGDVQGNMWAFDLCSEENGSCVNSDATWQRDYTGPLFTTGVGGNPEPITTAPRLARNTQMPNGGYPNLLVLFGSGQYLNTEDLQDTTGTAYYGVWDNGTEGLTSSNLEVRNFTEVDGLRSLSGNKVSWHNGTEGKYGWKLPLASGSVSADKTTGGERVVTDSLLLGSVLFFNTAIPSTEVCSSGGTGYLMNVDFLSGVAPNLAVFDANGDGVIDDSDKGYVGQSASTFGDGGDVGIPTPPTILKNDGEDGRGGSDEEGLLCINVNGNAICDDREWYVGKREGRLSWMELSPY